MPVSYIFRLFSGEYTNQPIKPIKPTAFNGNLSVTLNSARKDSGNLAARASKHLADHDLSRLCEDKNFLFKCPLFTPTP